MATNPETLAFAKRLKQALTRCPRQIRTPSELALYFNLNHAGQQVTNQSAQKWLEGHSKPTLEKMETLARLCRVSLQWLRYGIPDNPVVPMDAPVAVSGLLPAEQTLLEQFRSLSAYQRHLVAELVAQLALDWQMGRKADSEN
jgi:hypothetical protein